MAITATPVKTYVTSRMVKQTTVSHTPDGNVTGTNATVYALDCNNTHSQTAYFKIYDIGAVTYGTDAPDIVIPVAAGQRQVVTIVEGITMTNCVTWAASQGAGTLSGAALSGGALVAIATVID
tara:strand:+ start:3018 stop:3386 length:369 start_codon:yes stop_codon:yes gene_type:complete